MLEGVVDQHWDKSPHQPEKSPAIVQPEREPDEECVPQINSVRVRGDAMSQPRQGPETHLSESRDRTTQQQAQQRPHRARGSPVI